MKTRDRTSEVIVASNSDYSVTLFFSGSIYSQDTLVIEAPTLLGDDRHFVECLRASPTDLAWRFKSYHTASVFRLLLWILERHETEIYNSLAK